MNTRSKKSAKEIRREKLVRGFNGSPRLVREILVRIFQTLCDLELDFVAFRKLPAKDRRSDWSSAYSLGLARGRAKCLWVLTSSLLTVHAKSRKKEWVRRQLSLLRREFPLPQLNHRLFKGLCVGGHPIAKLLEIRK